MTYRDLVKKEHPENVNGLYEGGVCGCPSESVPGARDLCERGRCNGSEEKCKRCWDQEIPGQTSQEAKADKVETMITLKLERADIENLIEFFDLSFFDHLKKLLDADELDNMEYLASMVRVYDELTRAQRAGNEPWPEEFNRDPMEAMKES